MSEINVSARESCILGQSARVWDAIVAHPPHEWGWKGPHDESLEVPSKVKVRSGNATCHY